MEEESIFSSFKNSMKRIILSEKKKVVKIFLMVYFNWWEENSTALMYVENFLNAVDILRKVARISNIVCNKMA